MVVLLLIPLISPTVAYPARANNVSFSPQLNTPLVSRGNFTSVSIENIAGGMGLTMTLKNTGDVDLANLIVSVNITKGSFVRVPTTSYTIPFLAVNASTEVHIRVFGFCLGKILPLPELSITVSTAERLQKAVHITAKIVGPFTKIITTYFSDDAYDGYRVFSPEYSTKTFVIDKQGTIVHTWESDSIQGLGLRLLENGDLLRTALIHSNPVFIAGGVTGGVELFNWNGTLLWQFNYSDAQHCLHHDVDVLPNGHILMVAWEYKSAAEAIAAGRNPENLPVGMLWPDEVIEVERTGPSGGSIVWEWHVWDHLIQDFDPTKENYGVVAQHPELIDINYGDISGKERADWNHVNSIDYNEQFDQILLSARHQHEIWVIDHSTTTAEAAGHTGGKYGHGGDVLYRWGNPAVYDAGDDSDQRLYAQHDATWIAPGSPGVSHILIFNNGQGRPEGQYSSVDECIPPVDANGSYTLVPGGAYGPDGPVWSYTAQNPGDFFAGYLSSAQRLPNGNTLICDGDHGVFFEVTPEKQTVWRYCNTMPTPLTNQVFQVLCYPPDYPGLHNLSN
jgi:hypothetical protein